MTYITKQGDTFDSIAHDVLGHRKYTEQLMNVNLAHLETIIFDGNIILNIPEIQPEAVAELNLPPWR